MRAARPLLPLALLLPPLLLLLPRSSVCQSVAGRNVTEQERSITSWRTLHTPAPEMFSSGIHLETEEEGGRELIAPQFLVGDPSGAESQAKAAKSESGKKNPNKPKRKGSRGKKNKKKAVTPCEEKFKKYCVHGDCIYIEHLEAPSCKCYTNYFGERCVEQFLKTQKNNEATSSLIITRLPGILAVVLSAHCFAAIVVLVIVLVRKKYAKYDVKEERKKLRQENGNSSNDV